ncbi:MAG: shikimate kinase [Thermoplasmata archaeon]
MRGVGETTAAITIVNALPTGIGSAVGVDLRARAEVELHPAGSHGKWDVRVPEEVRTPLVISALTEALRRFAPGSSGSGELTLRTDIPAARGLKSSSAVSSAVVLAVARATDVSVEPVEIARMSAVISQAVGLSATGALDDALAGLSAGVVVTDNRRGELLKTYPTDPGLGVVLYIPNYTHRPSPEWASAFRAEASQSQVAVDAALGGDWPAAMRENTRLVERVLRYDYDALRANLRTRGAIASGVCGLGPTLAAVAPREQLREVARAFEDAPGDRRTVAFSSVRADHGGETR